MYRPTNQTEKILAILLHISAFFNGMLPIVIPLIIWLLKKNESRFLDEHGKSALNFQLTCIVLLILAYVIVILTIGIGGILVIPLGIIFGILYVIFAIIGAVKASQGQYYQYPFSFIFIK